MTDWEFAGAPECVGGVASDRRAFPVWLIHGGLSKSADDDFEKLNPN